MNIYEVEGFVRLAFEARRELSAIFMAVKMENKSFDLSWLKTFNFFWDFPITNDTLLLHRRPGNRLCSKFPMPALFQIERREER